MTITLVKEAFNVLSCIIFTGKTQGGASTNVKVKHPQGKMAYR